MSTVGVSLLAYCMPSISCLPPAPESPVEGSNTPMRTTLSPLAVSLVSEEASSPEPESPEVPPQAARLSTMAKVSSSAKSFFILFILLFLGLTGNSRHLGYILRVFSIHCKMNNRQKETVTF